jgi:hypothetical protein
MSLIRTLCLLVASFGVLSFTTGCSSEPGAPEMRQPTEDLDPITPGDPSDPNKKQPSGTVPID